MSRLLLGLILVGGLLFATNPSRPEFNAFVQSYVANKISDEARKRGEESPENAGQIGGALVGLVMPALPIERRNFLAFSIYDVNLSPNEAKKCSFLGIAGQFLPLSECKLN
ncbi:MAG: DUF4359 domain-containing protein [Alphaproteobacteria bacterium]|nr:DUF4359 domain-containing protein [Alphaproteobacteria bacterium]